MRKMVITLLALGVFAASAAFAGNLLNEGFSYPAGNLVPNDGWVIYSGAGDILVASGVATGQMGVSASGADDAAPFIGAVVQPPTLPTYACFDVVIPCASLTLPPVPAYFAGLKDGGTSLMVARVYVLQVAGGWTFGISHSSTNTTAAGVTPWSSTPLSCDTHYTIVIKYDPVAKSSTLWVNPVTEFSPSVTDVNTTLASISVSTFFLRQGAASSFFPTGVYTGTGLWKWAVDDAGVGTSFAEACTTRPVPVNGSTWGQLKSLYR